jgi:predicted type IV restriction endonuclease
MSELSKALEGIRKKLAAYNGRELNEQDTKTALINPILCALGWQVGDLEEVSQEFKLKPQDKPVDYAFFLVRTPKLFLEAKARGQNLDDRKWAGQIMGYAAVAGVKWVVITNGDEYRIYNASATVPVDEKIFRAVKISDGTKAVEETLVLLSKDHVLRDEMEKLWKAHFVDRQVLSALEQLIAAEMDESLIRLLRRKVSELSSRDIRASLARVRIRFDFPAVTEPPKAADAEAFVIRSASARKAWESRRKSRLDGDPKRSKRKPAYIGVALKDVIDSGLLKAPLKLTVRYKRHNFEATVLRDGTVSFQGERYDSCSAAAAAARGMVTGRPMPTNGWGFWKCYDESDQLVLLDKVRQTYLKRKVT